MKGLVLEEVAEAMCRRLVVDATQALVTLCEEEGIQIYQSESGAVIKEDQLQQLNNVLLQFNDIEESYLAQRKHLTNIELDVNECEIQIKGQ